MGCFSDVIIKLIALGAYQTRGSSSGVVGFSAFSVIGDYRTIRIQ
jgi:hypothetical protein